MRVPFARVAVTACLATLAAQGEPHTVDVLARLAPAGAIDSDARVRIDAGDPVVEVLPARGRDVAVFGAVRTTADGHRLVAWVRDIERLQRGPYVPRLGRFSDPPRLSDLDGLVLARTDLDDIRECRPGNCGLKLTTAEIGRLRRIPDSDRAVWAAAVQDEFRRVMLDRVLAYQAGGLARLGAFAGDEEVEVPALEFAALSEERDLTAIAGPELTRHLVRYPTADAMGCESFFYWSQEDLGAGKEITSITHVVITRSADRSRPEVLIASKQVSTTHYVTGSLSLMAITRAATVEPRYLVYARRSRVDLLDGPLGGLVRRVMEGRIRDEAPALLNSLRIRVESGDPPSSPVTRSPEHVPTPVLANQ